MGCSLLEWLRTSSLTSFRETSHFIPYPRLGLGSKSVAQVMGFIVTTDIRSGEPGYVKGAPPDGRIPTSGDLGVIGKAMDICRNGSTKYKYSEHYICAPGVDCRGYRTLVEGNGTLVARRVMGQSLAEIEQYIRSGDPNNPFHVMDHDDVDYYINNPDFDWENIKWVRV